MALTIETLAEEKWRQGKVFTFLHSSDSLAISAKERFVICVGNDPVVLKSLSIEGDAETLTWEAHSNSEADEGTGVTLNAIPRNIQASTIPGMIVAVNPTITKEGTPFFPLPIQIIGQTAAGNRAYISEDLIDSPFTMLANTCYTIDVTNNSDKLVRYDMSFNFWNS